MNIRIAEEKDFDDVKKITRETIMEIYPKYYPHGAVRFFAEHHSDENILKRGYHEIDYIKIDTGHGDYLCADVMEKIVEGDNE